MNYCHCCKERLQKHHTFSYTIYSTAKKKLQTVFILAAQNSTDLKQALSIRNDFSKIPVKVKIPVEGIILIFSFYLGPSPSPGLSRWPSFPEQTTFNWNPHESPKYGSFVCYDFSSIPCPSNVPDLPDPPNQLNIANLKSFISYVDRKICKFYQICPDSIPPNF